MPKKTKITKVPKKPAPRKVELRIACELPIEWDEQLLRKYVKANLVNLGMTKIKIEFI